MTDSSHDPQQNPYAPPPAPAAGGVPPVPAAPPVPPAPDSPPLGYQPPPAESAAPPYGAPQYGAPQQLPPAGAYPGQVPAPQSAPKSSAKTSSIISLVAGAVSIFILPWIAGIVGIGLGVQTLRVQGQLRAQGFPANGAYNTMAILGIVLGAIGIIAKIALDFLL
jgi:hypothetical protein